MIMIRPKRLFSLLISLCLIFCFTAERCYAMDEPDSRAAEMIYGIVSSLCSGTDTASVNKYIKKELAPSAGTAPAEWVAISLGLYDRGADLTPYSSALSSFLSDNTLRGTDSERTAMALSFCGTGSEYINKVLNENIGSLGIMSYIFGLILLDSGNYTSSAYTRPALAQEILSRRLADGGWALYGSTSDPDVSAMAVTALSPFISSFPDVSSAVSSCLDMLGKRQNADGTFSSMGNANCESTAQVLLALSSCGVDPLTDSRFIKNGSDLLDALNIFRLADGSFAHTAGGSSDAFATSQTLYALQGYEMYRSGSGRLFEFAGAPDIGSDVPAAAAPAGDVPAAAAALTDTVPAGLSLPDTSVPDSTGTAPVSEEPAGVTADLSDAGSTAEDESARTGVTDPKVRRALIIRIAAASALAAAAVVAAIIKAAKRRFAPQ